MIFIIGTLIKEWTEFLSGAVAALAAVAAVGRWVISVIEKRNKAQLADALNSWFYHQIRENLTLAAERAGTHRTRVIDIKFLHPEALIRLPVVLDEWLTVLPGCDIMGDQFGADRTTYFLRTDNTARIRRHTHEGAESVRVIIGTMRDLATGTVYKPGDVWEIPAGVIHSVHFEAPEDGSSHGLFMITVEPPLPNPAQVLLQLDGLMSLAG